MSEYIDLLIDNIDRLNRKKYKAYTYEPFPIEAANLFESIIKSKSSRNLKLLKNTSNSNESKHKYVYNKLYPSEVFPLFIPADRFMYLIFHLNSTFYVTKNSKLMREDSVDDNRYVKYMFLYSDEMKQYNYIDVLLELLKTISNRKLYKNLLYFALTFLKCLDTITYLSLKLLDDINYKKDDIGIPPDAYTQIDKSMKQNKNEKIRLLMNDMKNSTESRGLNASEFSTKYNDVYKILYGSSVPQCLYVCILVYNFFYRDNNGLKDKIDYNRITNTLNLKTDKFIFDKYDNISNLLLFFYRDNLQDNDYETKQEVVINIFNGTSILDLLKQYIDNYLFLSNNMIENMLLKSVNSNNVVFRDPFSIIYNYNFYFKYTFASYLWSTLVLFNNRDIFNRMYTMIDSEYTYPKTPDKAISKHYNTSRETEMLSFINISRQLVVNFGIAKHKYARLIPYLYLTYTNNYLKRKGIAMQISRLPYIKTGVSTSFSSNLKKTILGSWNMIPFRYNNVSVKDSHIEQTLFAAPVYSSLSFISTCCDIWTYTGKKKIKGSSSARGKFMKPPSYCNEMHVFTYNGDVDVNKDTFKKERRKYPKVFLNKIFIDIFKVNIMKEDLYGKKTTSFLRTIYYYDVSINLNIGDNATSAPLFFKNIKRVYKRKNQQDLKEACLCKNFDKYDYLKFFKIEGGVIYIYENFYNLLLEMFTLDKNKVSNHKETKQNEKANINKQEKENRNKKVKINKQEKENRNKKVKINKQAKENQNEIISNVHKLYNNNNNQSGGENNNNESLNNMNESLNNGNEGLNNGNECSEKIKTLGINTNEEYFNNNLLPFMYMKYDSKSKNKKLTLNYHPRHSQENIAVISAVKDPDEKEYGDKKKLNVVINPNIGQYTMNYFIVMIISNLFWYCISYKLSKDAFKKMFSVKDSILKEFDKSPTIFSKFDKIRLIDSKMNRILDYIFRKISSSD